MEENLHYSGNLACLCISEGWDLYDITLLSYCGQLHDFWHVLRSCHYSTSLSSSWQPWNSYVFKVTSAVVHLVVEPEIPQSLL